jgi:hypothetical protein
MYLRVGVVVGNVVLMCALSFGARVALAQTAPPIQGVTGTIATEGSIDSQKKAAGAVARGAVDAARKLLPGGGTVQNPLDALAEGSRVVVHDPAPASSSSAEGVVIDINRRRQQITVRFADKTTETLRVLDRSGNNPGAHVVVSLADQAGEKVGYDFTRVS